jgi:hypothetical protein
MSSKLESPAEPRYLNEKQAAQYLTISPRTLQEYRLKGGGPRFVKVGRRKLAYDIHDLIAYMDANKRCSTSDNRGA